MRLERGFRRIVIVLSASIVVLGAGLDVAFSPPRPDTVTVLVTLTNGRQVTLADVPRDVVPSPTDQALINTLAKDLGAGKKVFDLRKADSNVRQAVDRYSRLVDKIIEIPGFNTTRPNSSNLKLETFLVQWWDIRRVEVLRDGPQWWAWWWDHAYITSWAVGLAVFLWGRVLRLSVDRPRLREKVTTPQRMGRPVAVRGRRSNGPFPTDWSSCATMR